MARKKHLINVHTSTGTTAPTGASLYLGEIAVQHTQNEPALWIKVGSNESSTDYEKFIGETEIIELIDNSEIILGSGYTYSGLPYVNSATTISDAYSALTKELIDNENIIAEALNDLNDRIVELSGNTGNETDPIFTSSPAATITQEDIDNWNGGSGEGAVTAVTVTGTGNAVTDATFTSKSLTLTKGNVQATISDLETIRSNAASGMAAYNNVNALSAGTIDELSKKSNTGHTHTISEISGLQAELDGKSDTGHTHSNYATTGTVNTLRNTVTAHTANTEIHVTTAQTTAWDGKQDAIADLDTIRSNAEAGASKVSNVQADWNTTATTDESYIKNKPTIPVVPTSNTAFTNDAGYITGYTETDPTVPSWAKSSSKPTYTASEVGALPTGTTLDNVPDGTTRKLSDYSLTSHTHDNYATTGDVNTLSSATQNIQSSAQTAYNSRITGGTITSGSTNSITTANNRVAITAATLPSYSTANNDQVLMIKNGVPQWVTPATITYSSSAPTGGNEGDIWVQTS